MCTCFRRILVVMPCSTVGQEGLQSNQMADLEAQEGIDTQMPSLEGENAI